MEEKEQIGKCILCKFKIRSKGKFVKRKIYPNTYGRRKIKSASDVIYDRLQQHYEDEHLDVIMPVWMNSQASEGY